MLTIRPTQMQAFDAARLERFVTHAYAAVCRHWPRQVEACDEATSRERLRGIARQAQALGLSSTQEGLRLVNVVYALGDDYLARHPWAARIVGDTRLSPVVKLEMLVDHTAAWLNGEEVN